MAYQLTEYKIGVGKKTFFTLISIFAPMLVLGFIFAISKYYNLPKDNRSIEASIEYAFNGIPLAAELIVTLIIASITIAIFQHKMQIKAAQKAELMWKEHLEHDRKQWDTFIKDKQIVLNIDLTGQFSNAHITDLIRRLNNAFPSNGLTKDARYANVFALDSTSPRIWWSNSMLGYLAVLANWKAHDSPPKYRRSVSRIFTYHPLEFKDPLGVKIIILHILHGFDTYVIAQDEFIQIYNKMKAEEKYINNERFGKKEFIGWIGYEGSVSLPNRGYRSFWDIDTSDEKRKSQLDECDGQCALEKTIKWRDFQNEEEYNSYLELYSRLIDNSFVKVCNNPDKVEDIFIQNGNCFTLKITTKDVKDIQDVLTKYADCYMNRKLYYFSTAEVKL